MKCKNCGARLAENARVCPNCGAFIDDESGYTMIAADDRIEDVYSSNKKEPKRGLRLLIIALVVIALAAAGSYAYFNFLLPMQNKAPELTFTSGAGVINDTRRVVYIKLDNSRNMEYIHGVKLYGGAVQGEPLSTDYEYTKNVDSSFRTIFFYLDDLEEEEKDEYTYTFVVTASFAGSDTRYDYEQAVTFGGKAEQDVSSVVFDHSMYERSDNENTAETTAEQEETTEETTASKQASLNFIYESYWYGVPVALGETRAVDAYKFSQDGSYTVTHYTQEGSAEWSVTVDSGEYNMEDGYITITNGNDSLHIQIDSDAAALTLENAGVAGGELSPRVYNSVINANDLFENE